MSSVPHSRRLLLAFTLFLCTIARAQTAVPPPAQPPAPTAVATFVLDLDSSRVLEAKNPHMRMFPASTTKIMTCLVACERGKLNQTIRAGQNAAATGESGIGLLPGEQHSLADLIRAALVHSANDACVDIAEGVGGSQKQFVEWMNQKARDLGCRDTHFVNPHGLHDPNHYTSAHDLAVIGRAALKIPFINEVVRQKVATIGGNWKVGPQRVMINRNKLLFRWPECDGLKTGYTRQAGNCLVATATRVNPQTGRPWRLLAVALKATPGHSWPDCQTLLETAFATYQPQVVAQKGDIMRTTNVKGGAFALEAVTPRTYSLPLRASEGQTLSHRVQLLNLTAPIAKGAVVGRIEYFATQNGTTQRLADLTLTARDMVPQTMLARVVPAVGNHLSAPPFWERALFLGLLCLGAATILLLLRKHHVRRRPQTAFKPTPLQRPRDSSNPPRRDTRNSRV